MLSNNLLFLDTETTGLRLDQDIWEVAYAIGDGPINTHHVPHSLMNADPKALKLNGYWSRFVAWPHLVNVDVVLAELFQNRTVVGANPSFDTARLERRWGRAPWNHRMIDVESMAVVVFDLVAPIGLSFLVDMLDACGYDIPTNDHTAAGDVAATREIYKALLDLKTKNWSNPS